VKAAPDAHEAAAPRETAPSTAYFQKSFRPDEVPVARTLASKRAPMGFVHPSNSTVGRSPEGELITSRGEDHMLVCSRTGGGKGRSILLPVLLSDYEGSIICTDPKGEAAAVAARHRGTLGPVYALDTWGVLRELGRGGVEVATLNPMYRSVMAGRSDDFADDNMSLAYELAGEQRANTKESFWPLQGMKLLAAAIGMIAIRCKLGERMPTHEGCLGDVYRFLHGSDFRWEVARILDDFGKHTSFDPFVYEIFAGYLSMEADKVAPSVLSEAQLMCSLFGSPLVQRATSSTTIDTEALKRGDPMTIFLVIPPERLSSHSILLRTWLGTILAIVTRRKRIPPVPTLFLVDEVAHLGNMPLLRDCITLLRGYGVRVALFLQAIAQLKGIFGHDWETVVQNCGTMVTFGHSTLTSARQVADQLGDISGEALFALGHEELAIHQVGRPTTLARRLDYLHDPLFAGRFDPNPYYDAKHAR
jgi:type IV secretion system protein VirD4